MADESKGLLARLMTETWPARAGRGILDALMLPGQVAGGILNVPPSRPGMWSDEDEAKSQLTNQTMMNRATDLGGLMMLGASGAPALQNATGMGIRAYHGSPNQFDAFDLARAGSTTDAGKLGRGIYASTDPAVAKNAPYKYEVDADIKNPLQVSMPNWRTNKQDLVTEALGLPKNATAEQITAAAQKRGHDGVVLDYSPAGYPHQEIVSFAADPMAITRRY